MPAASGSAAIEAETGILGDDRRRHTRRDHLEPVANGNAVDRDDGVMAPLSSNARSDG